MLGAYIADTSIRRIFDTQRLRLDQGVACMSGRWSEESLRVRIVTVASAVSAS